MFLSFLELEAVLESFNFEATAYTRDLVSRGSPST